MDIHSIFNFELLYRNKPETFNLKGTLLRIKIAFLKKKSMLNSDVEISLTPPPHNKNKSENCLPLP